MKKTFTKEEFERLTHEIIENAKNEAEAEELSSLALMTYTMTYVVAFGELKGKLFDKNTDIITITTEKEF